MTKKAKVLVLHRELDTLSKIYLALVHRNFKTEATNEPRELIERSKRFKPAVVILGEDEFEKWEDQLKTPLVVLTAEQRKNLPGSDVRFLASPWTVDQLISAVEELVV